MSYISYMAFPRRLEAFRVMDIRGREREFNINFDISHYHDNCYVFPNSDETRITILDKLDATFNDCFKNPFVYEFYMECSHYYIEQLSKIVIECTDEEVIKRKTKTLNDNERILDQQSLYDFLQKNLNIGEFVEIYTTWHDHINFNFDPPTIESFMDYTDVLNRPISSANDDLDERCKITIHRTE